jgi:O-antigen/teichoic acid export membrane protein
MTSRYLAYTVIPVCVLLASVAPSALTVFYGPDYASGAASLAILAFSIVALALFTLLTTTLTAMGKTKQVLQINIVSALFTITLLLGLVPVFQSVGAATTRLIVQVMSLILAAYVLRRYVNVQLDSEALWKSTVASVVTIPFLFVLESTITKTFPVFQVLFLEILTAGLVYLASLYVLKALNGQDFELLKESFPKFLSKFIDVLQKIMIRK